MSKEQLLHNQDTPEHHVTGHKANKFKTLATAALLTVAGANMAQNSAVVEPKYYKTPQSAFTIPNLPSGSDYYLSIKAGESIYINIDGMDANTGSYYKATSPTKTVNGNTIQIIPGDPGNWLVNFKENGVNKTLQLHINYQADIYGPNGDRPETVRVDAGQTARLSGGTNISPTGTEGLYKRKNSTGTTISSGTADSVKVVNKGTYILRTNDATQYATQDTIAVLEKPVVDGKSKTISFPTTTAGVNYKVFKFQPAPAGAPMSKAPASTEADSAWVEIPSLAFTGDGNAHTTQLADLGLYRVGAQRTPSTAVEQNLPTLKVDFTNDITEFVNEQETTTFRQQNRELFRDTEVPSILYSIDGREIGTGLTNHVTIPGEAPAGIYIVRYTENKQIKTKKIVIK